MQLTQLNMIQGFKKFFNINGFIPSYTSATEITTNSGIAITSDKTNFIEYDTPITKDTSLAWVEGGSGGLASAVTLSNHDTVHKFLLMKANGTVDAGFDTDINATNLMADAASYLYHRRVSSFRLDKLSTDFVDFTANKTAGGGLEVVYLNRIVDASTTGTVTISNTSVPSMIGAKLKGLAKIDTAGNSNSSASTNIQNSDGVFIVRARLYSTNNPQETPFESYSKTYTMTLGGFGGTSEFITLGYTDWRTI